MYSVSEAYSKAVRADTREMPYRVKIAGVVTLDQTKVPKMTLTESASGNDGVSVGTANSASLSLTIKKADAIDYNDISVEPESGLVLPDGTTEWIPLGKFWVTNFSTSNDYETLALTCADGMYHMMGEYESKLTYPADVKEVVKEICTDTGVEFDGLNSLPDVTIRKKPEKMTYRDAIAYAAGCCGKNARFNRSGKLEFFWYEDSGITIERRTQYLNGMVKLSPNPLDVNFEVEGKQEQYSVNIISDENGVVTATPGQKVLEGETVVLSINPLADFELATITAVTESGSDVEIDTDNYTFIQPDSNVTVTAAFKISDSTSLGIAVKAYGNGNIRVDTEDYIEGAKVTVYIKADEGNSFDKFVTIPSSVTLTQSGTNASGETLYKFTMPNSDVTINAYFKETEAADDESKAGAYSWMALPANNTPPSSKPYWAVFYRHSPSVPTCQRYYLVWFDSWSASLSSSNYNGKPLHSIKLNGYYYCGSKNTGHYPHAWDTSSWQGNGASGSTITWKSFVGEMWDAQGTGNGYYCLIASNVDLYSGSNVVFQKCENAIQFPAKSYIFDGMDVREKGALGYYKCPDTFSTPAPASNWMILNAYGLLIEKDAEGKYSDSGSSSRGLYVVWFDTIAVENVGKVLAINGKDEEFYIASVTNGHYALLCEEGGTWGTLKDMTANQFVGLRNPLISEEYVYGSVGSGSYRFNGLMASSCNISGSGTVLRYKNDCKICDCASAASTFSLRKTATVASNAKRVNLTYTNPFISEKMVADVKSHLQNVTYTPAKVKHRGNPALEVGDIVTVPDKDGVNHNVLIMQQTFNFGGGMNSEITAPGQTDSQRSFSSNGPLTTQIKKEVNKSSEEIERRISSSNAIVFASMQRSIGKAEAKIKSIVEWQEEKANAISYLENKVLGYEAKFTALTEFQNETTNAISTIGEKVSEYGAEFEALATFKNSTTESLATINSKVTANETAIGLVSTRQDEFSTSLASIESKVDAQSSDIKMLVENGEVKASVLISAINGSESTVEIKGDRFVLDSKYLDITADGTIYSRKGNIGGWTIEVGGLSHSDPGAGKAIKLTPSTIIASEGNLTYDVSWYDLVTNIDSYIAQKTKIQTLNSGYTGSLIVMCPSAYANQYTQKTLTFTYGILTSIS